LVPTWNVPSQLTLVRIAGAGGETGAGAWAGVWVTVSVVVTVDGAAGTVIGAGVETLAAVGGR